MQDTREIPKVHYLRAGKTREHIGTFRGPVPREGEIVWVDPEDDAERLQYRVVAVEWQMEADSDLYARVYLTSLMEQP